LPAGKLKEGESYLQKAMAARDARAIKLRALDDSDLEGLWPQEL
jgi:hypothetical protein